MTRNGSTGENQIEGDYLTNAQGEDVVAGIRQTKPIEQLKSRDARGPTPSSPRSAGRLEKHYREMQDVEFTIERGKLWMLQTRDAKRTAQAAVRIAVDMVEEGLITQRAGGAAGHARSRRLLPASAVRQAMAKKAVAAGDQLAIGLNVSPGAAVGQIALDADTAEQWAKQEGRQVIMVRPETKPDDVHGMLAAKGILTSRGGRTSHAALVARQFGKPAVVGVATLEVDLEARKIRVGSARAQGRRLGLDRRHHRRGLRRPDRDHGRRTSATPI